jgi:putative transposase|tara:strand:- start:134 stop:331 length:198 start_codon:yes stop_codon:yes gene_type:complete
LLKYCIAEIGLNVYAHCITTNYVYVTVNYNGPFQLKDTIADFKKYTSKAIVSKIENGVESSSEGM